MTERSLKLFDDPLMSVVVCTYNRAELLADVLRTLCNQTLGNSLYEVIVIDNNSSDNTRALTEKFCNRYPNIRYFLETQQGLSHARNRGWQEAKGVYVCYTDDDCRVPEQWLAVAKDIIDRFSPPAFGGPIRPFFNTPKPRWYCYGFHEPLNEARFLEQNEYSLIVGGNSFFQRKLLESVGGFDPALGMSAENVGYGEETEALRMISATMPGQLYFDPRLYVYHLVQANKMTWRYNVRASFEVGRSLFRRNGHQVHQLSGRRQLLSQCIRTSLALTLDLMRNVLHRDRTKYPYIQNYIYKRTLSYVQHLGNLYERYRKISQFGQTGN